MQWNARIYLLDNLSVHSLLDLNLQITVTHNAIPIHALLSVGLDTEGGNTSQLLPMGLHV